MSCFLLCWEYGCINRTLLGEVCWTYSVNLVLITLIMENHWLSSIVYQCTALLPTAGNILTIQGKQQGIFSIWLHVHRLKQSYVVLFISILSGVEANGKVNGRGLPHSTQALVCSIISRNSWSNKSSAKCDGTPRITSHNTIMRFNCASIFVRV